MITMSNKKLYDYYNFEWGYATVFLFRFFIWILGFNLRNCICTTMNCCLFDKMTWKVCFTSSAELRGKMKNVAITRFIFILYTKGLVNSYSAAMWSSVRNHTIHILYRLNIKHIFSTWILEIVLSLSVIGFVQCAISKG